MTYTTPQARETRMAPSPPRRRRWPGGISAAVSMMAGTFLDIETANDQAASRIAEKRARYAADPEKAD